MSRWIAFIVISTTPNPVPLVWPEKDEEHRQLPSIDVTVNNGEQPDANIALHMDRSYRVHKMIGVEALTTVNVPTTATVWFETAELCVAAAVTLRLQPGVLSVSIMQVGNTTGGTQ